jgi:molybdate transport repressor ModE-like protein
MVAQSPLMVRFRVDFSGRCSVGVGKVELLEGIARTGSLSQAARDMRMSYRRAWLLLEDLNSSFDDPVAHASVGGRGGGGVVMTPFGRRLVEGYRRLESQLQPLAGDYLEDVGRHVKPESRKRTLRTASVKRKSPVRALSRGRSAAPR